MRAKAESTDRSFKSALKLEPLVPIPIVLVPMPETVTSAGDMNSESLALLPAPSHCSLALSHCLQGRLNLAPSGMGGCLFHQLYPLWSHGIDRRWILIQAWLQQASSGLAVLTPSAKPKYIASSLLVPKEGGRLPVSITWVSSLPNQENPQLQVRAGM